MQSYKIEPETQQRISDALIAGKIERLERENESMQTVVLWSLALGCLSLLAFIAGSFYLAVKLIP